MVAGIVISANDPEGRGRVQVQVPTLNGALEAWAPTIRATRDSPESAYRDGDRVLVAFERGDARRPYVIGFLWGEKDVPPEQR